MKHKIRLIKVIKFNFGSINLYKDIELDFLPQIGLTISDNIQSLGVWDSWHVTIEDISYDLKKKIFYAVVDIDEQLEDIESPYKTSQKSIDEFVKSAKQEGWRRE